MDTSDAAQPIIPFQKSIGFGLGQLWKGNLSLARSYWMHGVVFLQILAFFTILITKKSQVAGFLMWLLFIPYYLICIVGIWKSSDRYSGPLIYRAAAKVWVVFQVVSSIVIIIFLASPTAKPNIVSQPQQPQPIQYPVSVVDRTQQVSNPIASKTEYKYTQAPKKQVKPTAPAKGRVKLVYLKDGSWIDSYDAKIIGNTIQIITPNKDHITFDKSEINSEKTFARR